MTLLVDLSDGPSEIVCPNLNRYQIGSAPKFIVITTFSRLCILQLDCQLSVQVERLIYELDGKPPIHLYKLFYL